MPQTNSQDSQYRKESIKINDTHATLPKSKTTVDGSTVKQASVKTQDNTLQSKNPFEALDDDSPLNEILDQDLIRREEFEFIQDIIKNNGKSAQGEFNVHSKLVFYSNTSLWLLDSKN